MMHSTLAPSYFTNSTYPRIDWKELYFDSDIVAYMINRQSASRASLACWPCRTQHLKCDAALPICARCQALMKTCSYPESRRSARYKAAHSKRKHPTISCLASDVLTPSDTRASVLGEDQTSVFTPSRVPLTSVIQVENSMDADSTLLDLYYEYFHRSHPFILPRPNLQAKLASECSSMRELLSVMQCIGSSYGESSSRRECLGDEQTVDVVDGFVVQTTLLMALAKSMCAERAASETLLEKAIEQARVIGMHTKAFADIAAENDPVLAESWRRTWWMLYLADQNFSVIRYDFITSIYDTDHDVDIPCDDLNYCSTVILFLYNVIYLLITEQSSPRIIYRQRPSPPPITETESTR